MGGWPADFSLGPAIKLLSFLSLAVTRRRRTIRCVKSEMGISGSDSHVQILPNARTWLFPVRSTFACCRRQHNSVFMGGLDWHCDLDSCHQWRSNRRSTIGKFSNAPRKSRRGLQYRVVALLTPPKLFLRVVSLVVLCDVGNHCSTRVAHHFSSRCNVVFP